MWDGHLSSYMHLYNKLQEDCKISYEQQKNEKLQQNVKTFVPNVEVPPEGINLKKKMK